MSHVRRLHHRLTWIALLAILVGALMPTLSRAMAAGGSAGWTEVCTALGAKWVPVSQDAASLPEPAPLSLHGALDHCPYCTHGSQAALLPPVAPTQVVPCTLSDRPPDRFLTAPHTLHAWCSAQPRAPPAVS